MRPSRSTYALLFAVATTAALLGCGSRGAAEPPPSAQRGEQEPAVDTGRSTPQAIVQQPSSAAAPSATALSPAQKTPTMTASPAGTPIPAAQRLRGPQSVAPSPSYQPLPSARDAILENRIRQQLGTEIASYGVVVKRLADGRGAVINPDQQFYAASLYKLFVMYQVFKQRDLGLLSFDERLTVTPPYQSFQIGDLRWPLWTAVPIRDIVEAMITESDNVAAMLLYDKTGSWNMAQDFASIGLTHTAIDTDRLPTSAGDVALFLEVIAREQAISPATSREMIELLSRQKINDGLPALLPKGIRVAHKTGNWDNVTHDAGIVYAPSGAYVIATLSERAWASKPIADLSRLVYDYFEGSGNALQSSSTAAVRTATPTVARQLSPSPSPRR